MKKVTLSLTMTVGAAIGAAATGSSAFAQTEPIKFGAVVSVTGVGAGLGVNERNGLLLAEKTVNAKGGFKGRPIRIIIEDDTSNPDTAVTKVNDLIFNQKVVTVFGASLLGPAVAIGGITDSAGIPQLTFTGLGPAVELKRKCVFHMLPPHELNARGLYNTHGRSAQNVLAFSTIPATATWSCGRSTTSRGAIRIFRCWRRRNTRWPPLMRLRRQQNSAP